MPQGRTTRSAPAWPGETYHAGGEATAETFTDRVGCGCGACRQIRRLGPKPPGNPLRRLMAESAFAESEAASEALAELAPKTPADRRKRAGVEARRIRLSAGVSRMLAAMQGARTRNRKAGAQ